MGKNPAFMYYPKDWRADPVWGCSLAARGLWHELMDRMHESERYGYLCENGYPIPHERLARMVGASLEEFETLLAELLAVGVPRKTASGIIFSKRMVEDEKQRAAWRGKNRRNYLKTKEKSLTNSAAIQPYSSSSSPNLNTKTPLPPINGGRKKFAYLEKRDGVIEIAMNNRRRLPSLEACAGMRAHELADFLTRCGFPSRILEST